MLKLTKWVGLQLYPILCCAWKVTSGDNTVMHQPKPTTTAMLSQWLGRREYRLRLCNPGGGGYSLCDGWYICAAVLTPFFHFGRIEHDLFGVFFSSTNSKAIFWGTKTNNFYKNRSFWPQIHFFPRSFWVQFSAASGTHPSVFRPSTPPPPPPPPGYVTVFAELSSCC